MIDCAIGLILLIIIAVVKHQSSNRMAVYKRVIDGKEDEIIERGKVIDEKNRKIDELNREIEDLTKNKSSVSESFLEITIERNNLKRSLEEADEKYGKLQEINKQLETMAINQTCEIGNLERSVQSKDESIRRLELDKASIMKDRDESKEKIAYLTDSIVVDVTSKTNKHMCEVIRNIAEIEAKKIAESIGSIVGSYIECKIDGKRQPANIARTSLSGASIPSDVKITFELPPVPKRVKHIPTGAEGNVIGFKLQYKSKWPLFFEKSVDEFFEKSADEFLYPRKYNHLEQYSEFVVDAIGITTETIGTVKVLIDGEREFKYYSPSDLRILIRDLPKCDGKTE